MRRTSCFLEVPKPQGLDGPDSTEFRSRSKSLDDGNKRRNITDCETTYRIYDTIVKEGESTNSEQLRMRSEGFGQRKKKFFFIFFNK